LLPRLVGHTRASDWILTGRVFTAKEASDTGLFTKVLKRDQVLPEALACARSIIKECSPVMTTIARALLWQGLQNANLYQAHLIESKAVGYAFGSDDFAEGVASFFQKRAPQFPSNVNVAADLPSFYPWWTSLQVDHPFGGVRLGPKL
jgi:enoyl-CoA hydratase/carnithine racemase